MKASLRVSFLIACGLSVSGCSTIQSWFPDKEKDYQFTTELPPLIIPSDLAQKPSVPSRATTTAEPVIAKTVESATPPKSTVKNVSPTIEPISEQKAVNRPALADAETELSRNEIQISLTHENAPTLNLNVPAVRALRIIGKALSRSGIEITNRNQESGQIYIQIPNSKPKTESEKSFLTDTLSIFDGFVSDETSAILQFHESNAKTAVTLLNAELKPLTDGTDNKVLTLLFDAIKADLSK